MKNYFKNLLSVDWFTFTLLNLFFWTGLITVYWGWACLFYVLWFFLWIGFADKPKQNEV